MAMPHRNVFKEITMLVLLLAVFKPACAGAQSKSYGNSIDDLIQRAGFNKANGMAPDFSLRAVNGSMSGLGGYRGNFVFVNFWATWCGPCRQEMPSMERLYRDFGGQGLAILAVDVKESAPEVAKFMSSHSLSFPALLDTDGRVSSAYRVWGLPTTYLIDAGGRIVGRRSGPKDWASRETGAALRSLLGAGGSSSGVTASLIVGPSEPLPSVLRVKAPRSSLHAQQDGQSEPIATVERGEAVAVLGKASGAGETWYLVKRKGGNIGWIIASDLEAVFKSK